MGLHAGERGNLICLCSHSHRTGIPPNQWNGNAPASNYVGFRDASVTAALLIHLPGPGTTLSLKLSLLSIKMTYLR